ncbi:MAG TPA: hypothetical protein PKH39_09830 [Woeseiaceae bacterium]|nr:hypothetical protein [Woeseiaceae bacterium]
MRPVHIVSKLATLGLALLLAAPAQAQNRIDPDYTAPPPVDDKRPNETTWTYLKKIIDARSGEQEVSRH